MALYTYSPDLPRDRVISYHSIYELRQMLVLHY